MARSAYTLNVAIVGSTELLFREFAAGSTESFFRRTHAFVLALIAGLQYRLAQCPGCTVDWQALNTQPKKSV